MQYRISIPSTNFFMNKLFSEPIQNPFIISYKQKHMKFPSKKRLEHSNEPHTSFILIPFKFHATSSTAVTSDFGFTTYFLRRSRKKGLVPIFIEHSLGPRYDESTMKSEALPYLAEVRRCVKARWWALKKTWKNEWRALFHIRWFECEFFLPFSRFGLKVPLLN